mgnify:CR=1 FL=1
MTVKIIAELGSNPAASGWPMKIYCDAAALAGADAAKTQLFYAEHFPEAERESKHPLEFPRERLAEFVACAHNAGLEAGASVFDADAVALAAKYCDWLKLAAREQSNSDLRGLTILTRKTVYRSISNFDNFRVMWREVPMVTISEYPTPMWKSLLAVIGAEDYFRRRAALRAWGWSSHTRGWWDCALAVRLGASVIEKHICLLHNEIEGGHSLTPADFSRMTSYVRRWEI